MYYYLRNKDLSFFDVLIGSGAVIFGLFVLWVFIVLIQILLEE